MSRDDGPGGPASTAARPDAIRNHNLALMLGEVHRDGALTRAELTARLRVSRSTVAALATDLIALGFVQEVVPTGGDRAGRPSHVVAPHPAGPIVVAADVDVTHVTSAAVGVGGEVLHRTTVLTGEQPSSPDDVADLVTATVADLAERVGRTVVGVGVSVPGTVHKVTRAVGVAPNLGWRDAPLGALLRARLTPSTAVEVGNDADLSVLAEVSRGSARGCLDVVCLIGRTGVGAGVMANGVPVQGRDGRAGEIGHNVVDPTGPKCHCGKHGCLETILGDGALLTRAGRLVPATDESVRDLFAAARGGERRALESVRVSASWLGQALGNLVNTLNPQRVVLGGSLTGVLELARAEIEVSLDRYAFDPGHPVELVAPLFGADAALVGAAELAFAGLLEDPTSRPSLAHR